MAEVEQELDELLSAYVDGELSTQEEMTLRSRLEAEPALVAAVEGLRADRRARAGLWKSYEPGEAAVARLIERVDRAVDRQTVWSHRLSQIRVASAAAACILFGIIIGRATFGPRGNALPGQVTAQAPDIAAGTTNVSAPAQVRIVDGNGRPVVVQPFHSAKDAQQFIEDLNRWQREQEQIKNGGNILPADTEQF